MLSKKVILGLLFWSGVAVILGTQTWMLFDGKPNVFGFWRNISNFAAGLAIVASKFVGGFR